MLSPWIAALTFINSLLLVLICLVGDAFCGWSIVRTRPWPAAIADNVVHAIIGWASWALILLGSSTSVHRVFDLMSSSAYHRVHLWKFYEIGVCGLLASWVDLDHFIQARSWRIDKATALSHRPFLHNSAIPCIILILCLILGTLLGNVVVERAGFIIFVAMMSHHLRDAWRRGLWLPPLGDAIPIPYSFYILLVVSMPNFIRLYFVWRGFYSDYHGSGPSANATVMTHHNATFHEDV